MADKSSEQTKSIEMRLAEIEDKLSKLHITEDEMKAYNKVSALLGGQTGPSTALSPQVCFCQPIARVRQIVVNRWVECNECGPCGGFSGGGVTGGGGFGTLGG